MQKDLRRNPAALRGFLEEGIQGPNTMRLTYAWACNCDYRGSRAGKYVTGDIVCTRLRRIASCADTLNREGIAPSECLCCGAFLGDVLIIVKYSVRRTLWPLLFTNDTKAVAKVTG
jgi:hypothetical protein